MIFYLLKTGMWIGIFWLIYWLFLRRETFYRFNRHYLLVGLLLSFLIPLVQLKYSVEISASLSFDMPVSSVEVQSVHFDWMFVILMIYVCGIVAISVRYFLGLRQLAGLLASQPVRMIGTFRVVDSPGFRHPFSVFNCIFINSQDNDELARTMILEHEQTHIRQRHWIDLAIANLVCILQWFNPFVWLYVNTVKQNHEYLADRSVLQNGHSQAIYRAVLISCSLNVHVSALVHSFVNSGKSNRFLMMKKTASNPLHKGAVLVILPVLAVFLWAFAQPMYMFNMQNTVHEPVITGTADMITETIASQLEEEPKPKQQIIRPSVEPESTNTEQVARIETDEVRVAGFGKLEAISQKVIHQPQSNKDIIFNNGIVLPKQIEEQVQVSISSNTRLEANTPLLLLDGVEVPYSTTQTVNPNEIQSITVLKDNWAISSYGEKGKNGVILISTKETKE
jgi:TonB-dependent SusC/RagA subfamily outer membrane receptor